MRGDSYSEFESQQHRIQVVILSYFCKKMYFCLKRPKINQKRPAMGHFRHTKGMASVA